MTTLRAENFTLWMGEKTICRNVNFHFKAGEVWGILGQNGCGKTTLLHALANLHRFFEGKICLNEKPLSQYSPRTLAQEIGILFQDFNPTFAQTVWEYCESARFPHLAYYQKKSIADNKIILDALKTMELDLHLKKNILHLSGGEKRRLMLASLLAQTPNIYLLDEPTNHLDLRHQTQVLKILSALAKTKRAIVVMTLHDMNLVYQFCDQVILLATTGNVFQGGAKNTLSSNNLTETYQCNINRQHKEIFSIAD